MSDDSKKGNGGNKGGSGNGDGPDGPDEQEQIKQRRQKLAAMREQGMPFPNDFRRNTLAGELHVEYGEKDSAELETRAIRVKVAGRLMTRRIMGKASFAHIQDMSGQIQLYVQRDELPDGFYNDEFKKWDIGDIVDRRAFSQSRKDTSPDQGIAPFAREISRLTRPGNALSSALPRSDHERGDKKYLPYACAHG